MDKWIAIFLLRKLLFIFGERQRFWEVGLWVSWLLFIQQLCINFTAFIYQTIGLGAGESLIDEHCVLLAIAFPPSLLVQLFFIYCLG